MKHAGLVLGSVAIVAGAWLLFATEKRPDPNVDPPPGSRISAPALPVVPQPPAAPQGERANSPAKAVPALPSETIPLALTLPELIERAERGEPAASCRLTLELLRCQDQIHERDMLDRVESYLSRSQAPESKERLLAGAAADKRSRLSKRGEHCRDVDESLAFDAARLLPKALANLTPRQKSVLALALPDGSLARLPLSHSAIPSARINTEYLYPQFLAENAYPFLQAGIAAADPLALEGMLMVHSPAWIPGSTHGARLALPDSEAFAYYAMLREHLSGTPSLGEFAGRTLERARAAIPPERLARIEERAAAEAERWRRMPATSVSAAAGERTEADSSLCE